MRILLVLVFSLVSFLSVAQENSDGVIEMENPVDLIVDVQATESTFQDSVNSVFEWINGYIASVLFFPVFTVGDISLPFIIFLMVFGGIFFTIRYGFLNLKLFGHAVKIVQGKFDDPNDHGEISHFQALTSALSATVGLGNIAGVAVAIQLGGPGAVFWLWVTAFFGMSLKFSSCTFAQLYRDVDKEGVVLGGPMVYLKKGFAELYQLPVLGAVLSFIFTVMTIFASFGGGNMFQSNQTYKIMTSLFPSLDTQAGALIVGCILAITAAMVLIGGIKRIGEVTSKLVPGMCFFYCLICLIIIFSNITSVPGLFLSIFSEALSPSAAFSGGFMGVLITGVRRASFSNEAGVGSAAIVHAAAKTKEPVREGLVAMLGPFVDTIVVCTMTAITILSTGLHLDPALKGVEGSQITAAVFRNLHPAFEYFLVVAVIIFAYSTIISWSYYGEKAVQNLFGKKAILPYRTVYCLLTALGPVLSLKSVLDFSDLMILSMAIPNIIGMIFLSKKVVPIAKDYVTRFRSGQMKEYK